jgi:hypothetical protein
MLSFTEETKHDPLLQGLLAATALAGTPADDLQWQSLFDGKTLGR